VVSILPAGAWQMSPGERFMTLDKPGLSNQGSFNPMPQTVQMA